VLPPLRTRAETFEATVASTAQYLRDFWPDELADVVFAVAGLPDSENDAGGMDRWRTERTARRIVLFRHPIERLAKLGRDDDIHRRILVENAVFRAVGELLGKDPWELAPDRYRHLD
jgi:hypothetical protein